MKKILITDSLFIFKEHEKALNDAGYKIERLNKPEASEKELVEAVKDKSGYILGGIERVTDKVVEVADKLEIIAFTGADYRYFVPSFEKATEKGIAISTTPGANANAVSEFALAMMLIMVRQTQELGRTGSATFKTTDSLLNMNIGLVGMGFIGQKTASMLKGIGVQDISYYSRTRKPEVEAELGIGYKDFSAVLSESDLVSLHASKEAGDGYIGKEELAKMKDGAILINSSFESAIDLNALHDELIKGRLKAAHDGSADEKRFKELPLGVWYNTNAHTAFNTHEANKKASDMATKTVLNVLAGKKDRYVVNL